MSCSSYPAATPTLSLDANAAGWGWFVDPTPGDDSEFSTPGNQGEQNRMDLLTVLAHEMGHLLGQEHAEGGVMIDMLATGFAACPAARTSMTGLRYLTCWLPSP